MKQHLAACKRCGAVVRAITVCPPGDGVLLRQFMDTVISNVVEFSGLPCPVCGLGENRAQAGDHNWQMVT